MTGPISRRPTAWMACLAAVLFLTAKPARPQGTQAYPFQPGEILVADEGANAILRIDPKTGEQSTFAAVNRPTGIAMEADGNLIVAGAGNLYRVDVRRGVVLQLTLPGPNLSQVYAVAVDDGGDIIVTDVKRGSVLRVDPVTGTPSPILLNWGGNLTGIAVDADGFLLVADERFFGLMKLDVNGANHLFNQRYFPTGVAVDPKGDIFTVAGNRVVRAIPEGYFLNDQLISEGGEIGRASGIAVESYLHLLVADDVRAAIVRVHRETGKQAVVSRGGLLRSPKGIVVVPPARPGDIFVADYSQRDLRRLDPATGSLTEVARSLPNVLRGVVLERGDRTALVLSKESLVRVDLATGHWRFLADYQFRSVWNVALDPRGRIYQIGANSLQGRTDENVLAIDPATGEHSLVASLPFIGSSAAGITVDLSGNLVIAEGGRLLQIKPRSGTVTNLGQLGVSRGTQDYYGLAVDAKGQFVYSERNLPSDPVHLYVQPPGGPPQSFDLPGVAGGVGAIAFDGDGQLLLSKGIRPTVQDVESFVARRDPAGGITYLQKIADPLRFFEGLAVTSPTVQFVRPRYAVRSGQTAVVEVSRTGAGSGAATVQGLLHVPGRNDATWSVTFAPFERRKEVRFSLPPLHPSETVHLEVTGVRGAARSGRRSQAQVTVVP